MHAVSATVHLRWRLAGVTAGEAAAELVSDGRRSRRALVAVAKVVAGWNVVDGCGVRLGVDPRGRIVDCLLLGDVGWGR